MKINVEKKFRNIVNGHTEGFSMIELLMVLVIAGILMAIALPRLTDVSAVDIYTSARQAKSDIRYTQELAMSKYEQTTITFDANDKTYNISGIAPPRELPPSSNAIFVNGSTLQFTFNTSGEAITGGGGTLIISSGGSNESILVSSTTGKANIL